MPKQPYFPFYPGDWLRDPVSGCSVAAQGLWLRILMVMHDSERKGYLCTNGLPTPSEQVARRCGLSQEQYESLFAELEQAGVPRRTNDGVVFNRRMVEDARLSSERSRVGTIGGKQSASKRSSKPSSKALINENEDERESKAVLTEQIEQIYQQYPNKVGKPAATKAIRSQIENGAVPAFLLERVMAYAEAVARWPEEEKRFVPNPSTWFNQQRFNDDPRTWQKIVKGLLPPPPLIGQKTDAFERVRQKQDEAERKEYLAKQRKNESAPTAIGGLLK